MKNLNFLWRIGYHFIYITALVNAEGCKDMTFKDTLQGKALKNHVIKTKRAINEAHCESMCFLDARCIAYSFGRDKDQQKDMCELSESDHVMHPDDLVDRPDTIYRRAENHCSCQRFQVCRVNFVDNTHKCECKAGFTGRSCEIEIKACDSSPCFNGGTCTDNADSFKCTCAAGFTGKSCQTDVNCEPSPCMNGGTCTGNAHGYACQCPNGFMGKNCTTGYHASGSASTWDNAKLECEQKGAKLPSIHSAEENAVVWELYKIINAWMWIGLHDPNGDGNYVWSDGTPLDYTNWNPSPSSPSGKCVIMDDKQKWSKKPCSYSHIIGCLF